MQRFLRKKSPHTSQWGEETLCFVFIFFSISKSFTPSFCGTNYNLSSKATLPLFLKSYRMVLKPSKLFKPELQNNIAKIIKFGDKFVTNL